MARKDIIPAYLLANGTSLASSFNTSQTNIDYQDHVGLIIQTSGVTANTGQFNIQVLLQPPGGTASSWATLTGLVPALANADLLWAVALNWLPFSAVRVSFAPGGGGPNGTVQIWLEAKQGGG